MTSRSPELPFPGLSYFFLRYWNKYQKNGSRPIPRTFSFLDSIGTGLGKKLALEKSRSEHCSVKSTTIYYNFLSNTNSKPHLKCQPSKYSLSLPRIWISQVFEMPTFLRNNVFICVLYYSILLGNWKALVTRACQFKNSWKTQFQRSVVSFLVTQGKQIPAVKKLHYDY